MTARAVVAADAASLKRLAWAYGCARKGSDEERQLEILLRDRIAAELQAGVPRAG